MSTNMFKILVVTLTVATIHRINAQQCGINTGGAVIQQLTDNNGYGDQTFYLGGLFYDTDVNKLYFINRVHPTLYCIDGKTAEVNSTEIPDMKYISAAIPVKGNNDQMIGVSSNSLKSLTILRDQQGNIISITTNELTVFEHNEKYISLVSQVDKNGRLWIDSSTDLNGTGKGELLVVQKDTTVQHVLSQDKLPEGIGFSKDNHEFFQVDSVENVVTKYKFDLKAGTISDPTIVYNLTEHMDVKACLCSIEVAKNDDLWIGICEVGIIVSFSPKTNTTNQIINLPSNFPVSLEFGGPKMDVLYVGTVNKNQNYDTRAGGNIFAISGTGAKGIPSYKWQIGM